MSAVEGTTRVVGIFGDPVDHSLSPRMHNAAFEALGLDFVYVPLRPTAATIAEAVAAIRALGLVGVNVTVPFKQDVIDHLDTLSDEARAVGAVNTIVADENGRLAGANTDVEGFAAALRAHGIRPRGKRVLLIGAGGAARAVVQSLVASGAADVVIANRTVERARTLATELDAGAGILRARGLDALQDADLLGDRQVVVNSTSASVSGNRIGDYTIDATDPDCAHFDLAYATEPTAFIAAADRAGRPTIDGRYMLLYQGTAAFKLFTGRKAPTDVMARALGIEG